MMVDQDLVTVIFSKDRALQLELLLKTFDRNCLDGRVGKVNVLFKTTSERSTKAYKNLTGQFEWVDFVEEKNFKEDFIKLLENKKYILFLVDDCIFTRRFSLNRCIQLLENMPFCLGFSLRLGKNIEICYPLGGKSMIKPEFYNAGGDSIMFDWTKGENDWNYPLEVSSSIFRIKDILPVLEMKELDIPNPNFLEWYLSQYASQFIGKKPFLLSFNQSVAFCSPMNKVSQNNNNRSYNNPDYSIDSLLDIFERSKRIDYRPFLDYNNKGCHEEVEFKYV